MMQTMRDSCHPFENNSDKTRMAYLELKVAEQANGFAREQLLAKGCHHAFSAIKRRWCERSKYPRFLPGYRCSRVRI